MKTSRGFSEISLRHYPPRSITDVLWRSYLAKIDEIPSKSTFRNGEAVWISWNVVTIISGEAEKARYLPTASADSNLWAVCDKLDRFQTVRGRDAERLAMTIGILRWFSEHVCSRHVHKVPAKSPYAVHNLLDIFIWFPQSYFDLKRHINNYRIPYEMRRTHSVCFQKKKTENIFINIENLLFSFATSKINPPFSFR